VHYGIVSDRSNGLAPILDVEVPAENDGLSASSFCIGAVCVEKSHARIAWPVAFCGVCELGNPRYDVCVKIHARMNAVAPQVLDGGVDIQSGEQRRPNVTWAHERT